MYYKRKSVDKLFDNEDNPPIELIIFRMLNNHFLVCVEY